MGVTVTILRAEGRNRPHFLAVGEPTLSWQVRSESPGWVQAEARIEIETEGCTTPRLVPLPSSASQHVPWPAPPLAAYERARVRVAVRGEDGDWSEPSDWTTLETGPLGPDDWHASFVSATPHDVEPDDDRGTSRFRREFTPTRPVARATLSATAHGLYETVVNGVHVGDEVLAPGWTAYEHRLLFQTFDVTSSIVDGPNVLGATVAEGWYRERFGFDGVFHVAYPGPTALAMQLRLEYDDGSDEFVVTDGSWQCTTGGPTVDASIYGGETYDARAEDACLTTVGAPFGDGTPAVVVESEPSILRPAFAPPVRRIDEITSPVVSTSPSGATLLDFGQNLVGWLRLRIDAPAGTTITLRHAEVLELGELGVRPLRYAKATDRYTSRGDGPVDWSPRFTFHGFRYAEVTGWPGELDPAHVTAVVVHSDMRRTGTLETSHAGLNRLHGNVVWGMRGNFVGLPTDCPQRDERFGWTGDIQVFAPTAGYLYDSADFLRSWLVDLAHEQDAAGGIVPIVVPSPGIPGMPAAAWGDAGTLVPMSVYEKSGDLRVLADQYSSMKDWVEVVRALAGPDHLWSGGFQFGDWLDPSAPPENAAAAKTDPDVVATAYYARSSAALAEAARLLGRTADATTYSDLAESIRRAFVREYVTGAGRLVSDAHTAYALALAFGLLRGPQVRQAGDRLAELVRSYGYRIRTGFVGTPLICDALVAGGHPDTAFRLLLETGNPSWLYPISLGATTIWERWDSMLADGSINPGEMTSFNHYALGAVADWMHRAIGGIAPTAPGHATIEVRPLIGGGLTSSRASLDTGYGTVAVAWSIEGAMFSLRVDLPVGITAAVYLPDGSPALTLSNGSHSFIVPIDETTDAPAPVTLASGLGAIADDDAAREVVEGVFGEVGYGIGLGWTAAGRWRAESRLGESLIMFPPEGRALLESRLDDLARTRDRARVQKQARGRTRPRG